MSDTLVLNRSYYAVDISGWERALSLLYQGHAEALDEDLLAHDFASWTGLSAALDSAAAGGATAAVPARPRFIRTPSLKLAVPEVIRLTRYDRLPAAQATFTRRNLYQHYRCRCCYCGRVGRPSELNLDHVIPRSRGGRTTWENIVLACVRCNSRKGSRTPQEAGMKLLVQPSRPRWRKARALALSLPSPMPPLWQRLIDRMYWDSELEEDQRVG